MIRHPARHGFTLVELLVVMALIAIMATLAIAFFPNAASSAREARGAQALQGYLSIAKQRALRDLAPRGLRLWLALPAEAPSNLSNVVTKMVYIEQPDDFTGGLIQSGAPPSAAPGYTPFNCFMIGGPDLVNGFTPTWPPPPLGDPNTKYWSVQPGDYLEILGTGLMHKIIQVGVPNTSNAIDSRFICVTPGVTHPVMTPTANYRILRAPRPVGDEVLQMPDNAVIDLGTNVTFGKALPPILNPLNDGTGFVDILFAPNGTVISPGVTDDIYLWVRSPNQDNPADVFRGVPSIVAVFVRTGLVGAYNVDPNMTTGHPYSFVR